MKANELMVGDWVMNTNNQKPEQVFEILERMVMLDYNDLYEYNEIEPIPLTPEILERNGFERALQISDVEPFDVDEEGNKHYSYNKTFWGWFQPDNIFCIPANGMGWLYIKYVHQLQHALRLCEIEKEIIL